MCISAILSSVIEPKEFYVPMTDSAASRVAAIDSAAHSEPHRAVIRLLFFGFLLSVPIFMLLRILFGEPYPGPFMPGFSGTGIKMTSSGEAATVMAKMTVTFSDRSTAEVSKARLFGKDSASAHAAILSMIVPNRGSGTPKSFGAKLRHRLGRAPARELIAKTSSSEPSDDVRQYLRRRFEKIYPSNTPTSLTISFFQSDFHLTDVRKRTDTLLSEYTISFHEGI
jgi:hypothetical protein